MTHVPYLNVFNINITYYNREKLSMSYLFNNSLNILAGEKNLRYINCYLQLAL